MSKATPATTSASAPVPHVGSTRGRTAPAHRKPRRPAPPITTQDLIARIWDTLEWRKTLQVAFIITLTGITLTLMLAGLGLLLAHAMTGLAAAWPAGVSITITATVTYRAAHRRRR